MPGPETSVVVERNLLIPLPDGAHLAADLYRPAGEGPWPAIVDYLPYHKDGRGGRLDVEAVNRYFAARGYAALTVDIRGLGSSDGVNPFPFDPREAHDGHVAVALVMAKVLVAERAQLAGTIAFLFQPAEEGGDGAGAMIEDGVLEWMKPAVCFAMHLNNSEPTGTIGVRDGGVFAGSNEFVIKLVRLGRASM